MREILFRGKHKATGKWCEGNLNIYKQGVAIITPDDSPLGCYGQVDPDTVGQYTGLTDKNGRKIFEGDVVEAVLPPTQAQKEFKWGKMPVVFCDAAFGLKGRREFIPFRSFAPRVEFAVIGNIHDNPEILDGGDNNDK